MSSEGSKEREEAYNLYKGLCLAYNDLCDKIVDPKGIHYEIIGEGVTNFFVRQIAPFLSKLGGDAEIRDYIYSLEDSLLETVKEFREIEKSHESGLTGKN